MLGLGMVLLGALAAEAADPCARVPVDDGVPTAVIEAPTAFDPVGDLLAVRVDAAGEARIVLDFRLPGDHPVVRRSDRRVQLELDDGAVVPLTPEPTAPIVVEFQNALAPGLVLVDVPVGAVLAPDVAARLAGARVTGVRLLADPDHAWLLKRAATTRLRRALACAVAMQAGPPAAVPAR